MTTREQLRAWCNPAGLAAPVTVPGLSRQELAEQLGTLGLTRWVEIGVADGRFAAQLHKAIPTIDYTGVDPYRPYRHNRRGGGADQHDQNRAIARARLPPQSRLLSVTSEAAAGVIEDGSLDVVYIDGNHDFDYVMLDLLLWSRKVRPGGVVAGHDFYEFRHAGVIPAVTAYTAAHGLEWYLTDGSADTGSDKHPSFFWAVD